MSGGKGRGGGGGHDLGDCASAHAPELDGGALWLSG